MIKRVIFLLFVIPVISCSEKKIELFVDGADPEGWPQWRGANHNSFSSDKLLSHNLDSDLDILWRASVGKGYSAPSVQGNNLVILGNEDEVDVLRCFDTITGAEKWSFRYESKKIVYDGARSTPAIDGNNVYFVSVRGQLYCIDIDDGTLKWEVNIPVEYGIRQPQYDFSASVIVESDLLLLNLGLHGMAFTKEGELVWGSPDEQSGYANPVVFDYKNRRVVAMQSGIGLYVVEVHSGELLFSYPWNAINGSDPLIFDEKIFLSSVYGLGCSLIDISEEEPKLIWKNYSLSSHFSSSFYLDGQIYGADGEVTTNRFNKLVSLDAETGEVVWKYENGLNSFIFLNNTMVTINHVGELFFIEMNGRDYKVIYTNSDIITGRCWTAPVYAYGILFIRNHEDELVAVNIRNNS